MLYRRMQVGDDCYAAAVASEQGQYASCSCHIIYAIQPDSNSRIKWNNNAPWPQDLPKSTTKWIRCRQRLGIHDPHGFMRTYWRRDAWFRVWTIDNNFKLAWLGRIFTVHFPRYSAVLRVNVCYLYEILDRGRCKSALTLVH